MIIEKMDQIRDTSFILEQIDLPANKNRQFCCHTFLKIVQKVVGQFKALITCLRFPKPFFFQKKVKMIVFSKGGDYLVIYLVLLPRNQEIPHFVKKTIKLLFWNFMYKKENFIHFLLAEIIQVYLFCHFSSEITHPPLCSSEFNFTPKHHLKRVHSRK